MKKIRLPFYLVTMFAFISCEDLIVPDISGDEIVVRTPADGLQTSSGTIVFWWEPIDGATSYELSIVTPDLSTPQLLVFDSTTIHTRVAVTLTPNKYQWCVQAFNSAYQTPMTCRGIVVEE